MDVKVITTVFITIFLAELGDKTQLATLLFAAQDKAGKLSVFIGAALALVLAAAIAVVAGAWVSQHISERTLRYLAGAGFIAIGFWSLLTA